LKRFFKKKQLEDFDLLVIIALVIFIQYTIAVSISYYYPKYYVPMLPFLSIVLAFIICQFDYFDPKTYEPVNRSNDKNSNSSKENVDDVGNQTSRNIFITMAIVAAVSFILMALLMGDPNLSRDSSRDSFTVLAKYIVIFFSSMFILMLLYRFYCNLNISAKKAFFITVILCLTTSFIYINAVQADADYEVRYNYGEVGMDNTIDYIKAHTNSTSMMISPKDVGYYSEIRYYEAYGGWMESWDALNRTIQAHNISHIVLRRDAAFSLSELPADVKNNIFENFTEIVDHDFGDFVVFERKY
jgi:hypothetical protein